jgi:hypothetical protein
VKKEKKETKRILGRKLAKGISAEDMKIIVGGAPGVSVSGGEADDCDFPPVY